MVSAAKLRVADRVAGCPRSVIPQPTEWQRIGNEINPRLFLRGRLRKRASGRLGQRHGLIVKGKRISCPPQYGHRYPQGVPRRLGESHGFELGFPLIRSLRASAQPSTSVLFSFVVSFDYGRIIHHQRNQKRF
jgi:hypothetical protein